MPFPLLILALSSFAIGTTEFIIMGLLPEVANSLAVSIPQAGWLVTGYALGVALGAPVMVVATHRLPRRAALIGLMSLFVLGNLLCALATGYSMLMVARVVTSLCHGAFFGIGSVVAAGLVAPNRRAQAVALMFTGLTLANVLGVPLGTALGQAAGWRVPFWAVAAIGVLAIAGLARALPRARAGDPAIPGEAPGSLLHELGALRSGRLWMALASTVLFSSTMFALFTYIAPLLRDVTNLSPQGVTWTLLLIGVGLTLGNLLGGRLADWRLGATLAGVFVAIGLTAALFAWTSHRLVPAEITLFAWAIASFAAVPALQVNVVRYGQRAPNLVSTLNIGAFNAGNALGAWIGGLVIEHGFGLTRVPLAAALLALVGLGVTALNLRRGTPAPLAAATE